MILSLFLEGRRGVIVRSIYCVDSIFLKVI